MIDASAFVEEPIAYGWRDSPFVNVQEQLRTFVLADDVEVLVLGGDAAARPCRDQDPPPRPTWLSVETSYLDLPAATEDIASLTYSTDGQVVRIRFTQRLRTVTMRSSHRASRRQAQRGSRRAGEAERSPVEAIMTARGVR